MPARRRVSEHEKTRRKPATTPEGRENEMVSAAIDLAERQIRNGETKINQLRVPFRVDHDVARANIAMEEALGGRETNMITRRNDPDKTYLFRSSDLLAPIVKTMQQQQAASDKRQDDIDAMKTELLDLQKSLETTP